MAKTRTKKIEETEKEQVLSNVKGIKLDAIIGEIGQTTVKVQNTLGELTATLTAFGNYFREGK